MTIVTVQWSDLPAAIPMRSVRWLDERQFCPVFLDRVHFGIVPEHGQLVRCKSWAAGACTRVGSKTLCALLDPDPDLWRKAKDWVIQGDGTILFDPRHETVAHRSGVLKRQNGGSGELPRIPDLSTIQAS